MWIIVGTAACLAVVALATVPGLAKGVDGPGRTSGTSAGSAEPRSGRPVERPGAGNGNGNGNVGDRNGNGNRSNGNGNGRFGNGHGNQDEATD